MSDFCLDIRPYITSVSYVYVYIGCNLCSVKSDGIVKRTEPDSCLWCLLSG